MSARIRPTCLLFGMIWICCVTVVLSSAKSSKSKNFECLACTVGVAMIEQLGQIHNETITVTLQRICNLFSDEKYQVACKMIVEFVGKSLIDLLHFRYTPDVVCAKLKLCPLRPGSNAPKCHLFPKRPLNDINSEKPFKGFVDDQYSDSSSFNFPPMCKWPGAQYFCNLLERFQQHTPVFDVDLDGFSTEETLRGSAWRGKDCNDLNPNIRPGVRSVNYDVEEDHNCNGILGIDHNTSQPYEKLFCEQSQPRGLMIIGDSAGAHFHIPEQWADATQLNRDILDHLPYAISNEMDWPMASFTTGYKNVTWPIIDGFTVSVYDFLKNRNRCNHRDYHNLGVNGAGSVDPPSDLKNATIRNNKTDYPLLLFYEFVGNDVCNNHKDTLANMTTPEQMRENVLRTLHILNYTLPYGSHILMTGLANGTILWEALSKRLHPLGHLNKDVRYPEFYDFLTCIGANPCNGWMTTNDTLRRLTTERAYNLSKVLHQVAKEFKHHYRNFDVEYIDCPLTTIADNWRKKYGEDKLYQLIEPTDGFHPNQLANNLIAQFVWNYMETQLPHYIGPVNPHNAKIEAIFGDQGGY